MIHRQQSAFCLWSLLFSPALILLSACSGQPESDHVFTIYEEDGVTIAETSGGPKYVGELFEYEELYHLEQDESRVETLLASARIARMDEDGFVFVTDGGNDRIAVFNPDGTFSHAFGREGDGPGEFRSARLLGVQGDTALVIDTRQRRIQLFNRDGRFINAIPYPPMNMIDQVFFNTTSAWPGPDGSTVLIQQGMGQDESGSTIEFRLAVLSSQGEAITDIRAPKTPLPRDYEGLAMTFYRPGFGCGLSLVEEPVVELYDLDGTLQKKIRIIHDPEPVTQADRDVVRQALREDRDEQEDENIKNIFQERLDDLSFPPTKSFWFTVTRETDGFFWASIPGNRTNATAGVTRNRILSPEGEYLGITTLPNHTAFNWTARLDYGHLIFMYEDEETGAPQVLIYRIRSAVRGLKYP